MVRVNRNSRLHLTPKFNLKANAKLTGEWKEDCVFVLGIGEAEASIHRGTDPGIVYPPSQLCTNRFDLCSSHP